MAPEIFERNYYSYKVDIYAFSIVAYVVLTGKIPFNKYKTKNDLRNAKIKGKQPNLSKIKNEEICNFLKKCMSSKPNERPSFSNIVEEMLKESFLKAFDVDKSEVEKYLSLFDEQLKDPTSKDEFDHQKQIDYGNLYAIRSMAVKMYYGIGVEKDIEKAFNYFQIASQRGDTNSTLNYAQILQKGRGTKVDKVEAARWYKNSAFLNESNGMLNYAYMLYNGEGIEQNKEKAAHYFKMAADMCNFDGMTEYGMLLQNDIMFYDPKTAEMYLKLSTIIYDNNVNSIYQYGKYLLKYKKR